MKKILQALTLLTAILLAGSLFNSVSQSGNAATITRGITFASTDLVTNTKLHQLVDNATISSIDTADIADSAITTLKLGANSVTTAKILNGTILTEDLADASISSAKLGTNSVDGVALASNITFKVGTYTMTNSYFNLTNTVLGLSTNQAVTNSVGSADAGKLVLLPASGKIPNSMLLSVPVFTTSFTSGDQTITDSSTLTIAHGLTASPRAVFLYVKNTSTDAGYSVDDVVQMGSVASSSGSTGFQVYVDSTNVYVNIASSGFNILHKTSHISTGATSSKWVIIVVAYL